VYAHAFPDTVCDISARFRLGQGILRIYICVIVQNLGENAPLSDSAVSHDVIITKLLDSIFN
jgi:hypothetical protein